MRFHRIKLLFTTLLLCVCSLAIAQPANDNCATATNIGALPTPQSCTSGPVPTRGVGAPITVNTTNNAATPSSPYPSMSGCQQGNASTASPASDVWYQVTITGSELVVGITGGINNPNFALWQGACGSLVGLGCATGNAGTLNTTFSGLLPGVYLIQISGGNINDRGNFALTLQNDNNCAACMTNHTLTVSPLPTNGFYQAGTAVNFCFRVTGWTQQSANWLSGVELTFGAGWNVPSIVPVPPTSSCDGTAGTWGWYNSCTSTATGAVWGNGFYFDRNNDGNPGNNFGDNCTTTSPNITDWVFCWTITTRSDCGALGFNPDLSVSINTLADGEAGSWGSIACQNDPDIFFSAQVTCCPQPLLVNTNVACFGACTATATATGQGTGPWNYTWINTAGNTTIRTANGVVGPDNITGLCAGTYIVRTFDVFEGCTAQDTFTVTQPTQITGTPAVVNVLCNGGNTGSITINGTAGGVGPYQYSLNGGPFQGSNVFGGLIAGTYTVTIRDASLCTVTLTNIVVNQPAVITGTPAVVNVLCNGGNTGSITINATAGGVGPYQYSLNGGPFQGSNVFGGLIAGTYTVTIRDANLCTVTLTNIVVNQPAAITGTPAVVNVLCNGGNTGSITINGTAGGVGPYQYSLNGGPFQGSNVFGGLIAGTYTVTIRDANLCPITLTNIVVNQPAAITGTPAVVNVLCNGGNTGSITINATAGGVGPYQYSLNGGPFQGSNVFGGLTAGTYTVTIRDANLCTVTLTNIVVNQPAAITGTPAVVNVLCNGGNTGSITINGTAGGVGPYQYRLNGGPFQGSNVFGGLTAGTYTVTIRDANLCTVTLTNIVVNEPAVITGTPAVVNVLCNGGNTGSITINATAGGVGPYQYSLNGGPFQGSNVFGGLTAGTYTVTIRDANLCTVTLTNIVVNQPAAITGTPAVVNVLCNGGNTGSITINATAGGVGPYQYSLNGGPFQGSNVFGGLIAGTYTVTIRDANLCTITLTNIVVNQPAAITGTPAVVNVLCNGGNTGSITINATAGGVGPYQYSLNGGPFQGANVFPGLTAGTYTVTIRDANLCTVTLNNIVVTEPAAITGTPAVVNVLCNGGNTGSITINATAGGVGPYQYSLNGGPFQGSNVFPGLTAGTYTVTIRDANLCTVTLTNIVVNEPAVITGTPAVVNVLCNGGNTGSITINATAGGVGPYQYSLSGGPFQGSNVFGGLTAGTYTVTIQDANLCTVTLTNIVVTEPAVITGTPAVVDVTCGANNGSITINATAGGVGPYQYSLNGGPFQGSNVFPNLGAGTYTVTIQDANLCTLTLTNIVVSSPAALSGTPAVVNVTCNGGNDGSITINAVSGGTGPYDYSLNGGPFQVSNVFPGLTAGTYTVTIRDANLCTRTLNNIVVTEPAAITGTPAVVDVLCNGGNTGSITINATAGGVGPYQYSLNGGPFQGSNIFGGLTAGAYTVTIRDANLCTVTLTNIVVNEPAVITGTPAVVNVLCNGGNTGSITINATAGGVGPYQYSLNGGPFQGSNVFGGLTAGTYTVTIRDANLCTVTLTNIVVTEPAVITGTPAVVNVTCGANNGSITINATAGGVGPYQYSLSGGPFQGSNVFPNLGAGTYTVTIQDANLCTLTLTNIVVSSPAALSGTPAVVNVTCNGGNDGSITINAVSGGTGPYDYSLNGGPFQVSNVFPGLTAGTYTVTIRDANLCTVTLNNIVVTEPAAITGTPAVVDVLCNGGNTGSITINATAGGVGPYQYSLNGGPFQGSNVFPGLTAGTYTVTIQDANLCTVTLTNIVVNEPAVITGTPAVVNVLCNGGNTGSITINATAGGVGPYQYSLSGGPFQGSNVFGGLTAGTYTVTIQDANLCTVTLTNIVVTEPAVITGTPAVVDVTCGANNGSITINATAGGVGPYQYSLNGGPFQGSNVFPNLGAGTYTVTIQDANLCTLTLTNIVVSSPAALSGTPAVVNVTCNGGNDGSITINAVSGGTGPYDYSLNGGPFQVSNVFPGLTAGTYTVTIRDANLCTTTLNNIVVTEPAAITGTPAVVDVPCNGGNAGSITINATAGGVGPYQYSLNGGPFQGSNVFPGLTAGTYTVTIRDANLCTVTLTNIVVNEPAVITGTPAVVNVLCNGGNTGSITINATAGGVGPYQYSLSGGPFQGSNVFGGLTAGTYTVTIQDANLCTVTLTNIFVTEPAVITGTPAVVDVTCGANNGSITINATAGGVGPYQYSLNGGPFQGSNVFPNLGAGTYTVTIQDANLCTLTLTNIVVSSPAALSGTPAVVNVTCNGGNDGSITINAVSGGTGPYDYSLNGGPFQVSNVFPGLTAGTYTVTIRDANLCTTTLNNIVVTEPAAITGTPAVVDVLCNGGNTGSITINATAGGVGPYQYSLNGGPFQGSNVFPGLTAGTYTVTIQDANLCTVTLTNIVVNEPAVITGTPAVVNVLCNGGNTGSITINATAGGVGPYQYSLSGGPFQGSNVFGGLTAGTYTVTIQDANLCTVTLTNIVVTEPAVITGTPAVVDVTCGANNGSITINATAGGVGPYQYSLNGGPFQGSNVFPNLGAGTYTVTIQDANLCTLTLTNIVVSSPAALSGTPAVVNVTCNGGNDGSITINAVSGGTGPYDYSLNGGPFQVSNVFPGLTAGTYTVTIRDANLCTTTLNNIVVTEPAAITGTPAVVNVLCNGGNTGSITINATAGGVGPYQYSLNGGPFQGSNVFPGLTAGTYTVTIQDVSLCTVTLANIVVNEPAALAGTPAVTDVTCNGANDGTITLNGASGGVGPYQFSLNGGPLQSGNAFLGLAPGTYSLDLQDANGCLLSFNGLIVNEPALLTANDSTVTATCVPGNDGEIWILNTNGGVPGYEYSLDGGPLQVGNSFTGVAGGAHTVVVTDLNGCSLTLNITVPIPGGVTATDSTVQVTCNGANDGEIWVNAAGGVPVYQYSLNGGPLQGGNSFTNLVAGSYTIVAQDQLGCAATINVVIGEPTALSAVDSVNGLSCFPGGSGEIWIINPAGGTPGYQYSLNGGPLQSNPGFTALGAGTFEVSMTDANGCTLVIDTVTIDPLVPIQASTYVNDVTCNGAGNGEIGITQVSGGLPPYTYSIDSLTWGSNPLFGGLNGGIHTVWILDSLGCTLSLTDTIGEAAPLSIQPTLTQPTCSGNDGAIHLLVTGGVSPYTYQWGNGSTADSLSGIGVGTYFVTVTDNLLCQDTLVVTLSGNGTSPVATIVANGNVSCFGGQDGWAAATVTGGTAPFQYLWNSPVPVTGDTLNGVGAGVWTVYVTDALGCVSSDSVTVTEPTELVASLDSVPVTCFAETNGSLSVIASGGTPLYSYLWNSGDTAALAANLGAGAYSVTVTDANGCQVIATQTLSDPLPVIAGFNSSPSMPAQLQFPNNLVTFQNTSQNADFYSWNFGDGGLDSNVDPSHTYDVPGDYCVVLVAEDSAGCTDTLEVCNFVVLPLELDIPNTFTPNNDGRNDVFQIVGIELYPNNHLAVYNRWGNLVYEKDQYDNSWKGDNYKNGAPLPDGAYYYIFTTGEEGQKGILGDIVIFR